MSDASKTDGEEVKAGANVQELRSGRWNTVGIPTEKSDNFSEVSRRLARMLTEREPLVYPIVVMAHSQKMVRALTSLILSSVTSWLMKCGLRAR